MRKINYKKAGVDIKKAEDLSSWIKTQNFQNMKGDYASLFPFSFKNYNNPVLAASTDGVGTKLKLASYFSNWKSLGQDLVAMCVNDLICVGAKPLFFLDYYACGRLDKKQAKDFLKGVQEACTKALCPLVGGETAEMPGLYKSSDIDCAGFCVGVVEKSKILNPKKVRLGDHVIAFPSSGFHSNGYSLIRKIYKSSIELKKKKKQLMRATRLYTFLSPFLDKIKGLRTIAHITGGGLNNLSRIIPPHFSVDLKAWNMPPCFLDLKKKGQLSLKDMLQTFNCGLGLILILKNKKEIFNLFPSEKIIDLGVIKKRKITSKAWTVDFKTLAEKNSF